MSFIRGGLILQALPGGKQQDWPRKGRESSRKTREGHDFVPLPSKGRILHLGVHLIKQKRQNTPNPLRQQITEKKKKIRKKSPSNSWKRKKKKDFHFQRPLSQTLALKSSPGRKKKKPES